MTNKIDERIASLGFENKDFQRGIAESSKTLADFDKTLANSGVSGGSAFSGLSTAVGGVGNSFNALGVIAATTLSNITNKVINAGEQLIKSLAVEPIMQGYQEYELKINSIRTMLASGKTDEGLPVTLDQVNTELQKLNEYSDQTIYSFADMTQNIGKFTNAGVSLPKAVQAIKGVANAAALSGSSSEEASRAMYNFAQALSSGYVKLIDWKSIELANMGTVEFKQQLLDAAVAAGTVEKTADGMYKVLTTNAEGKTMKTAISATQGFNDSLQYQWMTTETLTDTLSDYADATTEIGKKATEAATKVRTWSQLMDTTREAVGSGWSETFEIIVGDYDEATDLYTGLSGVIGDFVKATSDGRNQILKDWKDLGGRTILIAGIKEAWRDLLDILKPIREAFENVFPPLTGKHLADISTAFMNLFSTFYISAEAAEKIKTIFQGFFSAISLGFDVAKVVFDVIIFSIKELLTLLPEGAGNSILDFAVKIGQFFIDLRKGTKQSETFVSTTQRIKNSISSFISGVRDAITVLKEEGIKGLSKAIEKITDIFSGIKFPTWITDFISKISGAFDKIRGIIVEVRGIIDTIVKPILSTIASVLGTAFSAIKDAFGGVWNLQNLTDFTTILQKIMLMLLTKGLFDGIQRLISSFTKITDTAGGFLGGITSIFDGVKGSLKAYQDQLKANTLMQIATAVAILTGSLVVLAMIDAGKLTKATMAITALFANLAGSFILLEKTTSTTKMSLLALQLIGLSIAIGLMTIPLLILSKIKAGDMNRSLLALAAMTAIMAGLAITLSKIDAKTMLGSSIALSIMAFGISKISDIITKLGNLDPEKLKQGLVGLAAIFAQIVMLALVLKKNSTTADSIAAAIMLTSISGSLTKMAKSITTFGDMKAKDLVQGLIGVTATLGILLIAMKLLAAPSSLAGAAAMLVMSTSILILVPAIKMLGELPIANVATALLTLAGVFAIVGVAGLLIGPITPVIIALAGGIALLGVAVLAIGVGIGAAAAGIGLFALGLASLAALGTAGIALIATAVSSIAMLIPLVLTKVAEGLVEFAKVVIDGAPIIAKAISTVIGNLILLLTAEVPKLVDAVLTFISDLLQKLILRVPEFTDAGMKIILGFLKGIRDNIQPIVETGIELITNYLNGLTNGMPKFIEAGSNLLNAFMQGLSTQVPILVDQAFKMIISFINGMADAIRENTPALVEAGINLATALSDGLFVYFGITSNTSEHGKGITKSIIQGMIDGIKEFYRPAVDLFVGIGRTMMKEFKELFGIASPSTKMFAFGENIAQGLINGIRSMTSKVVEAVKEMGQDALDAIQYILDMNSPSKAFAKLGTYVPIGFGDGISKLTSYVVNKTKDLGDSTLNTMTSVVDSLSNSLLTDLDSPTITPVLDLSNITSGANKISSMLSQDKSYGLAQEVSLRASLGQNEAQSVTGTSSIEVKNEFSIKEMVVRTEADIDAIAKKLYQMQETAVRSRGLRLTTN